MDIGENRCLPASVFAYSGTGTGWPSRRRISAQLPVTVPKFLCSLAVHKKDNILMLPSRLQADAATAHADECRCAPPCTGSAAHDAIAMLATDDEPRFGQIWNHGDAFRIAQQRRRNLVR